MDVTVLEMTSAGGIVVFLAVLTPPKIVLVVRLSLELPLLLSAPSPTEKHCVLDFLMHGND